MKRFISILFALVLVLSFSLIPAVPVAANGETVTEVSQPIQVTNDSHYERGQSIVYGGGYYWLFYGRSAGCTASYATGTPDVNDYVVYYKDATTVAGLAGASATAISDVAHNANGYLGETGAAYFGDEVWAFATIDVGTTADLYGWWTADGGSTWNEVGPIVSGLSDGQGHHDETVFDGELWVVEGSGNFTTMHSATPKTDGWNTPLDVDAALTGGLVHFFVDGTDLYLAINASDMNYIYKYDSTNLKWDKVDENSPPNKYDPTLFKVGSDYMFAQAPWDGAKQYILQWSGSTLDDTFFDTTSKMVTEGAYGTNPWVDMWPIGFTDAVGDSYLFFTSERDPAHPEQEMTGNIWYLPVDWTVTNDHYTYIQESIDAADPSNTISVAAGTYDEQVVIDKALTLQGAGDTTIIKPSQATVDSFQLFCRESGKGNVTAAIVVASGVHGGSNSVTIKDIKIDASSVSDNTSGATKLVDMLYSASDGIVDSVTFYGNGDWPDDDMYLSPLDQTVTVEVKNCTFSNFWKNAITANFEGLTANIHDNTVTGRGEVPEAVQNGIQYGWGATGTASSNIISDIADTTGDYTAVGILFYDAGGTATGNTITNCETGIQFEEYGTASYSATVQNNTIDASGLSASLAYTVGICLETFATSSLIATIDGNNLSVGGPGEGISIGDTAGGDVSNVDATISNNEISGWNHGIWLGGSTGAVTITGNTITNNVELVSGIHIISDVDVSNISAHFNNIEGNEGYGVYNIGTGTLDAENNWWGHASGPYDPDGTTEVPPCTDDPTTEKNANGTGDKVSDNVDYCPWTGAATKEAKSKTVTGSGTIGAANTVTGIGSIGINATGGDHTVTTAKYESNPGGTPTFSSSGNYYDVHLDNVTNVNSLTLNFCPATATTVIYYWNGTSWVAASNQTFAGGCIVVTVTGSTHPSLSELTGLPFGSSSAPSGGVEGGGGATYYFGITDLAITPTEVYIGEAVTITAEVKNKGDAPGSYTVKLKINGVVEEKKTVTLAAHEKKTVTFTVIKEEAGTYKVEVNGLKGEFIVSEPPPASATFEVTELSISPAKVKAGETVTIGVLVAETSGVSGSYSVTLKINDEVVATEEVTLDANASQTVTFTIADQETGSYKVEVNGLVSEFTVEVPPPEAPSPPASAPPAKSPINWPLLGGIIGGVIVVGLIIFFLVRRRAY